MKESLDNVYLDSNVFIFAACSEDEIGTNCKKILDLIVRAKVKAITSCITFDEIFYKIRKLGGFELAVLFTENLLNMPNLSFVDLTPTVLANSVNVLKKHKLAPKDALHVATAQLHNAHIFVSEDADFSKIPEIRWLRVGDFLKRVG